jgi:hypothetical protein
LLVQLTNRRRCFLFQLCFHSSLSRTAPFPCSWPFLSSLPLPWIQLCWRHTHSWRKGGFRHFGGRVCRSGWSARSVLRYCSLAFDCCSLANDALTPGF